MKKTKGTMKKILGIALVLIMVLSMASCAAGGLPAANDAEGEVGDLEWKYTKDDNTLTIKGEGEIPDSDSSENVPWAEVRHSVKKVKISDDVTYIGDYAFYYMPELTDIDLPEGITAIGDCAFAFCKKLDSLEVPLDVTSIGDSAFEGCTSLEAIMIPTTVTELGDRAFAYCSSLETALILGNVESIGDWCFKNCTSLEKLTFNAGITEDKVADNAFESAEIDYSSVNLTKSVDAKATLTVNYVDEDGKAIEDTVVEEDLSYGERYKVVSPKIEGYTADRLTVSGMMEGEDVTVNVTYTKDAVEEEDTEAESEATTDTETTDEGEQEDKPSKTMLIVSVVILGVVIAAIVVAAILLVRSDKKKTTQTVVKKDNSGKNGKKKK